MKFRVELTDENGFVFSRQTFDNEKDMEEHIEGLREGANEIFQHTSRKLIRIARYYMPLNDWVEGDIESLLL